MVCRSVRHGYYDGTVRSSAHDQPELPRLPERSLGQRGICGSASACCGGGSAWQKRSGHDAHPPVLCVRKRLRLEVCTSADVGR